MAAAHHGLAQRLRPQKFQCQRALQPSTRQHDRLGYPNQSGTRETQKHRRPSQEDARRGTVTQEQGPALRRRELRQRSARRRAVATAENIVT